MSRIPHRTGLHHLEAENEPKRISFLHFPDCKLAFLYSLPAANRSITRKLWSVNHIPFLFISYKSLPIQKTQLPIEDNCIFFRKRLLRLWEDSSNL